MFDKLNKWRHTPVDLHAVSENDHKSSTVKHCFDSNASYTEEKKKNIGELSKDCKLDQVFVKADLIVHYNPDNVYGKYFSSRLNMLHPVEIFQ